MSAFPTCAVRIALFLSAFCGPPVAQAAWPERLHPLPDRFDTGPHAGSARVAIDGDTAVVGHAGNALAQVFVREANGAWTLQETLSGAHGCCNDSSQFGYAVAISGDRIVVGAPGEPFRSGRDAGMVYVYRRSATGWVYESELEDTQPDPGARFGAAVAIDGNQIAVGAPGDTRGSGEGRGSVSLFRRSTAGRR